MLFPLQLVFSGSSGPQATEAESSSCHDETNNGFMEPGQGADWWMKTIHRPSVFLLAKMYAYWV